jgi:iron complex transport system substrate-binding protein
MSGGLRVVSFLPAGTEIAYAIGAGDTLVGRSHECDYPSGVRALPVVSKPTLELDGLSQAGIDGAVATQLRSTGTLYAVDEELLRQLEPDVILTQDLCQVCAPSGNELTRAVAQIPSEPELVWLSPRNIEEIHDNIRAVGQATGHEPEAEQLIIESRDRLHHVRRRADALARRRVVFLEWIDPFFSAGHWVPEMIALAGASDPLGNASADSGRIDWDQVMAAAPEILIVAPCGYGLARAVELARTLPPTDAEVWAVDANAYFARPGPRVADGVELLASIFHPAKFGQPAADRAVRVA